MSHIVACPSCQNPLRVADQLVGQQVRCPTCQTIFQPAIPAPATAPTPAALPSMGLDEAPSARANTDTLPTSPGVPLETEPRPKAWGAVEVNSSPPPNAPPPQRVPPRERGPERDDRDRRPSRQRPPDPDEWERRPPRRMYRDDDDYDRPRRRRWHGEGMPHRGGLVLTMGILSLCFAFVPPLGLVLGICAWVMGAGDLGKIRSGEMDPEGQSMTNGGHVCGILGTIGSLLLLLFFGTIFLMIYTAVQNTSSPPPPPQQFRPGPGRRMEQRLLPGPRAYNEPAAPARDPLVAHC
jgi:hypothetical protein